MLVSAFRNKESKFTADLWTYTISTDGSGGEVKTFVFNRTLTFSAVTGNFGKVDVFFQDTESDVLIFDQLYNFKGPDSHELKDKGVWQVEMIAPFINMWGHREGFRARVAQIGIQG